MQINFTYFYILLKSIISISFAFLFLLKGLAPGMDVSCELQKLPNLFAHYQEHKACNDNSFFKFLVDDYLNFDDDSQRPHHDDTDHEDLPFHGNHQCGHTSVFYASAVHFSIMALENAMQAEFAFYKSLHSYEFLDSPFQPPKA